MDPIADALAIAIEHHQAGRLAQAEQLYRQILQQQSNSIQALHRLGILVSKETQAGQPPCRWDWCNGTSPICHPIAGTQSEQQ